jgi:hypothetical protein
MTLYIYRDQISFERSSPDKYDDPLANLETMRVWAKRKGQPEDIYVIQNGYQIEEVGYIKNLDVSIDMDA